MARKKRRSTDAVEILREHYFAGRKDLDERHEQETANLEVTRKLYELRTGADLTQRHVFGADHTQQSDRTIRRFRSADAFVSLAASNPRQELPPPPTGDVSAWTTGGLMCGDTIARDQGLPPVSVVVRDANIMRLAVCPSENHSPSVVDPNTVKAP